MVRHGPPFERGNHSPYPKAMSLSLLLMLWYTADMHASSAYLRMPIKPRL